VRITLKRGSSESCQGTCSIRERTQSARRVHCTATFTHGNILAQVLRFQFGVTLLIGLALLRDLSTPQSVTIAIMRF